ncbi:hypothetical protein D3C76_1866310 [compost metagenome]
MIYKRDRFCTWGFGVLDGRHKTDADALDDRVDDGFAAVQLHDTVQRDVEALAAFLHQLTSA